MTTPQARKNRRVGPVVILLWLLFGLLQVPGAQAAGLPQILAESVSGITETSAVLEATIDPGDGDAYFQFQLGPERQDLPYELLCPLFMGSGKPCEGSPAPGVFPIGKIEGDSQTVKLDIGEWAAAGHMDALNPGTPYRFRVVAAPAVDRDDDTIEWEEPVVVGMTKWFSTLGPAEPALGPAVEEPVTTINAPLRPCRKAMMTAEGRCSCRGYPARTVKGKVRCVKPKGLPYFRLLRHLVGLSHLPRSLQFGLSRWLPPTDPPVETRPLELRGGTVYLGEVGVYGVGGLETVCMRAWGGSSLGQADAKGRNSACVPVSSALKRGVSVVTSCTGTDRPVQITGLVPNGVTGLGVDRYASGEIEEVIPVKTNAFAFQLERVGVVLHGLGPAAEGFEMKLPLRRLLPSLRCLK